MQKDLFSIVTAGICMLFALESYGAGWTRQTSHTAAMLGGTHFVDENTGFIAGDSGIVLKTKNGGATWTSMSVGSYEPLMYLQAIDSNLVYICAWNGKVWKTTNGGATWNVVLTPFDSTNARGIFFTGAEKGFLCVGHYPSGGTSRILRTKNGGTTWDTVYTTNEWLSYIHFPDEGHGYATGSSGRIAKTSDSGASWAPIALPGSMFMSGVFFLNKDTGYVGGVSGMQDSTYLHKKVFRTEDGGTTWTVIDSTIAAKSLFFVNDRTGYAIGGDSMIISGPYENPRNIRLMMTQNGGATWERVNLGTNLNQNAFWFTNANTGYVTGDSGMIFKYQGTSAVKNTYRPAKLSPFSIDAIAMNPGLLRIRYSIMNDRDGQITFSILTPQGVCVWKKKITCADGSYSTDFSIPSAIVSGTYIVKMSALNTQMEERTFVTKAAILLH